MPKKKIKQSLLSKLKPGMKSAKPSQPTEKVLDPALCKWYQDITVLPLNLFIDVAVDGKLSALIIEGNPGPQVLAATWTDIQQQYADVVADNELRMVIKMQARHAELLTKMEMFDWLFAEMQKRYCDQYGREMNTLLKTNFIFDPKKDREGYYKLLTRCHNRAKAFSVEFRIDEIKLEGLLNKRSGSAPSREYYQGVLIGLSDFAKYAISDKIMVWEFCERMRVYNLYDEKLKAEIAKPRKK